MYSVPPILDKRLERAEGSELDYTSNRAVAPRQVLAANQLACTLLRTMDARASDMMQRHGEARDETRWLTKRRPPSTDPKESPRTVRFSAP
jgi:hypothetical protein